MKRILLIEDNGNLSYDINEKLRNYGYEIKQADSVLSARGMWKRYNGDFNCIILDLNVNPEGLSPNDSSKYFPCCSIPFMLEIGWGAKEDSDKPKFNPNIKVVVYSGYVNELKGICSQYNIPFSDMVVFEKRGTNFVELVRYIKESV